MPASAIGNPLVVHILGLLVEQPMHQYALRRALSDRYPEMTDQFSAGSIYALVGSLAREGWIETVHTEQEPDRRPRTVYTLTTTGWETFRTRVAADIRASPTVMTTFATAIAYLGALTPAEAMAALRARQTAIEQRSADVKHVLQKAERQGVIPLHMIEGDLLSHQLEGESHWIERLIARIATGDLAWPDVPPEDHT